MSERLLPSQRSTVMLLERSRVFMEEETVVHATTKDGRTRLWNVPHVNTSVILLGQGTSITQGAMRKLAEEKVLVAFTGTGATPIFMGAVSEYAATEHIRKWISIWPDPERRLICAKVLAKARADFVERRWQKGPIPVRAHESVLSAFRKGAESASDIAALRGHEGDFARSTYKHVAIELGAHWEGRTDFERDRQDSANRLLDQGNYLAYGLAGVVLWALGLPPGLAVNHGTTRAGGLVFDLADVIKDAVILPRAFRCAATGMGGQEFRDRAIDDLDQADALPHLFDVMLSTIAAGVAE